MQNKNLKLKLGLCGLALTSFLAVNAHSVVHADTVSDSNANNNAITWDSDSDDSQVIKKQSEQQTAQNAQVKQIAQAPAVQKVQSDQPQKPVAQPSRQASVQSNAQVRLTQPVQNNKVMVSNVSSSASVLQKRAETSIVRQSNTDTNTVNRLNADNHQAKTVKVSNIDSDAQAPVQTQVIAKLSPKAKTYAISIATTSNANDPMPYSGYSRYDAGSEADRGSFTHDGWIYNGQIYTQDDQSALETALGGNAFSRPNDKQVATINPQYIMSGTEFLTDTGVIYNNQRVGLLIIPKFTELKPWETYSNDPSYSGMLSQNNGFLTPYTEGFLPALAPTDMEWTGSELEPNKVENWHMTYSYTAVPIDMNTGKTISGISLDGTATKPCNLQTYLGNQTDEYGGDSYMTPFSDTTITGSAISSDQNLVSPYIKPFLDGINSGKIQPYLPDENVDYYPVSGDHGGKSGIYNHYNTQDFELKGHGQNTTFHKFMDDTVIPYTENLLYLTLKTRQVNPQDSRAHKSATRVISVNLPDDPAVKDRYKGILNSNDQIVQTINFTRTGTENIADGAITWGKWSGPSSFPSVTLPDIPGYTITMG